MNKLYEKVFLQLEMKNQDKTKKKQSKKKNVFELGDWVWVHFPRKGSQAKEKKS